MNHQISIKLAVFLGNPGKQYSQTRHNAGRMLLETLPEFENLQWREKFHGKTAEYTCKSSRCRFLIPETFMNRSGLSISKAVSFYKIELKNLLVVHDDLELPFGRYSWREGGGMAGHNGLKSIKNSLGGAGFHRLRIGIGRPDRGSVQSWVLSRFSPDEEAVLPIILKHAGESFNRVLNDSDSIQNLTEPVTVYPAEYPAD